MTQPTTSLFDYTGSQLGELCSAMGLPDRETPVALLGDLLGPAGARAPREPPRWPSVVADDHTPVEYSIALDDDGSKTVRIFGETLGDEPTHAANVRAARALLASIARRYPIALERFRRIEDLFLPEEPRGKFVIWFSFIFRPGAAPDFKVYLNPLVRGDGGDRELVAEGCRRLGLAEAYDVAIAHGLERPSDRFLYFALDLKDDPSSRVKLYVLHPDAEPAIALRASEATEGVDAGRLRAFCDDIGGPTPRFRGQPLVSGYTFVEGDHARPSTYSLYLPVRDYTHDDEVARARVRSHLERSRVDPETLDRALAAVARRPLAEGSGLIAHVSLRLGGRKPGTSIYLSAEAFGVNPPHDEPVDEITM